MGERAVEIQMLGGCAFRLGDLTVSDGSDRSRKVWLLLAYLACNRRRAVSAEELTQLLDGGRGPTANPSNAMKAILHRARTCLKPLEDRLGRSLILRGKTGYQWDPEVPAELDIDAFQRLCQAGERAADDQSRLNSWREGLALYQGDFLPRLSAYPWAAEMAGGLRRRYLAVMEQALALLEREERWSDLKNLSQAALQRDNASQTFFRSHMTAMIQLEEQQQAAAGYAVFRETLYAVKRELPNGELRSLYRAALRRANPQARSMDDLSQQIREPEGEAGAQLCEYDFFQMICRSVARSLSRSGDPAHLVLVSVTDGAGSLPPQRSLDCAMDNLKELLREKLRQGDTVSQCSGSQYAVLLPGASLPNSQMVCERLRRAFFQRHPHSPVRLEMAVQPLEPGGPGQHPDKE